ncbi:MULTISPECIES: TonB-dependent receptor [Hyphomicrobiales]|uniref:OrfX protein n=1 Tax=Rhizobium sp. AC100 TaxID=168685 RepID=Q8RR60_9HYPH|nr:MULTISPECIES: TonB-dependent receptor [Hyphomicrobiales]QRI93552.1 TonB-dependent receptor [Rhizobium sp.]BAB85627.1 orfX [Rhizobium sp. AC100]
MRSYLLISASIILPGLASPSVAQALSGNAETASSISDADGDSAEIVVTASRRSDSVKNTPIAVTAIGGDALRENQIANLADLASSTPNIQISTSFNNANIAIRGVGNSQFAAGSDAGVAVHSDGVYLGQSVLALATMNDVERVEILRGPQGTLFGRNATGGAINIIPKRPTEDLHYGVEASFGLDPAMVRSSAYVSGSVVEGLRGRLSLSQNYNKGYTKNLVASSGSSAVPSRLDDADSASIRAQLEAGTGAFVTRLSLEYMKDKGAGPSIWLTGTPSGVLPPVVANTPLGNLDKRQVYNNYGYKNNEAKFATLISTLDIGQGQIKATASYGETRIETLTDGDGTAVDHTSTYALNNAKQTFGELIYASDPARPLGLILGANYFHERSSQAFSIPISTLPPPLDVLGPVVYDAGASSLKSTSYAAFGQAQYKISDAFRVFAGLRYSRDRKAIENYSNFGVSPAAGRESWSRTTYELGASLKVNANVTGYAKYGTGYKGGGYSAAANAIAFNPETNTNMEIGLKGNYLGGALQANLAGFHMKYKNLQVNQAVGAVVLVTNAARATINGFEAELKIRPVQAFRVDLNASWLDARFDDFFSRDDSRPTFLPDTKIINGIPVQGIDLEDNRLPTAPKYAVSAGAYYDISIDSGLVTVGGRYDWKSRC